MDPNQPAENNSFFKKLSSRMIILMIVIVGVAEGVILIRSSKEPFVPPPPKVEEIGAGEIFLFASRENLNSGEKVRISIKISTGGKSSQGADVALKFDPKYLEASASSIHKGGVYPDYPVSSVDNKKGIVRISGITSSLKKTFKGVGILGFIDFKAKQKGQTNISIEFEKGKTNESNIIEGGTSLDILGKVNSLDLNIH